jgi:hypothetical protein
MFLLVNKVLTGFMSTLPVACKLWKIVDEKDGKRNLSNIPNILDMLN